MAIRNLLKLALAFGVSCGVLALVLQLVNRGIPEQDRPSVLSALQNTSVKLVLLFVVVYLVTLLVRAYRYQLLLRLSGEEHVPNLKQMALVTGIRNMIVDLLPARLGELGYLGLLNKGYGVKLQHCASSLAISIAFDFIALLVIVLLIVLKQLAGGQVEGWAWAALVSAVVLAAVAIIGLFTVLPRVTSYLKQHRWVKTVLKGNDWKANLLSLLEDFASSIDTVRRANKAFLISGLSVAIRLLKYFSFYILFMAVAVPSFTSLAELPSEHVVSALIGGEIGASLPIPSIMSFGTYEAGGALVVHLLGIADKSAAVVTLLSVHIWSQFMEYLLGGFLLLVFILLRGKRAKPSVATNKLAVYAGSVLAAMVLLGGSFFLAWELRAAKKMGAVSAPEAGQTVLTENEKWRQQSQHALKDLDGFVVWSSNRGGNHDIYRLSLPDITVTPLTSHAHTEYFPRLSPNGKRMIFSRSHQPWVSQRNVFAWDVIMLDLQSGEETVLANKATYGQWVSNDQVTVQYNGTMVDLINVDSGERERIYESGVNNAMPVGARIHTPSLNQNTGQLLFTAKQAQIGMHTGHWGTAVLSGEQHQGILNGCEIIWSSDGLRMYQVTPGGYLGSKLVTIDPETLNASLLVDLAGEFSKEYWPKDASNGEYLVFGASRGDQEHDQADYEIFLWKKGSDPSKAHRITFHTGNDNWPDVHLN